MLQRPATQDTENVALVESDIYSALQTGSEIPLCCPIHRNISTKVADPAGLHLGFCRVVCLDVLPCKHPCSMQCHWPKLQHKQKCTVQLDSPCQLHAGQITCLKASQNSPGVLRGSDYNAFLVAYKCPEKGDLILKCGHVVPLPCWEENEIIAGKHPWPECKKYSSSPYLYPVCKHTLNAKCCDLSRWAENPSLVPKCRELVFYDPPCGHKIQMECWRKDQHMSRSVPYQCQEVEKVDLPRCGHSCKMPCILAQRTSAWTGMSCDELGKVIEGVNCGSKDYDCQKRVTFIKSCGHQAQLPCEEAFNRASQCLPCTQMVSTFSRICGHRCMLTCAQEVAMKGVPVPGTLTRYVEGQIPILDPALPFVKCTKKVELERRCGHLEDIICSKARKPLNHCKTKIQLQKPSMRT